MRPEAQHIVVLLLGGALLRIAADATFLRHVRPALRWWLLGAGAVLVVLAVVATVRDLRGRGTAAAHDHGTGPSPWLLVLPVLVIALVAPPALGAEVIARQPPTRTAVLAVPALPPGPAELGIGEAVVRSVDGTLGDGRDLTVTGFLAHHDGDVVVARLTISCCAADARPHTLRLRGPRVPDAAALPVDTWVRVRGSVVAQAAEDNRWSPDLDVTELIVVAPPQNPYEL